MEETSVGRAERYRAVIDAMPAGIAIHDVDGSVLSANPAAERMLRLTGDQIRGDAPVDPSWRLTREDGSNLPQEEAPWEVTCRTGRPCSDVVVGVERRGARAWLSVSTAPIRPSPGSEPTGVVSTLREVTGPRETRERGEESEARLQRVMGELPGVVAEVVLRPERGFECRFLGGRVEEIFGVRSEALLADGEVAWSIVEADDAERARVAIRSEVAAGRAAEVDVRFRGPGGGRRWARIRTSIPEPTPEGVLLRCIVLDVTREKKMAARLRVAQRSEAVGSLTAGIAHNFNNMLGAILPSVETALALAPEEIRPELEVARDSAVAAAELVDRLMLLAGRPRDAEHDVFDLTELVDEVVRICRSTFGSPIRILHDAPSRAVPVRGRRSDVRQAVLNLCINARDALEGIGDARVRIRLRVEEGRAVVSVSDNGPGLSDEARQRLGEPFFTTKPVGTGTGLGVVTAIQVVRNLGGELTWRSRAGEGATFEVRVPLAGRDAASAPSRVAPAPPPSSPTPSPEPEGVPGAWPGSVALIVDDEPGVRRALRLMLEHLGLEVLVAGGGRQGLERLEEAPVDVVFLDLSMPDMSGEEVLRAIRARLPELPVVIMSGHVQESADLVGAREILTKPFGMATVDRTLARVLPEGRPSVPGPSSTGDRS